MQHSTAIHPTPAPGFVPCAKPRKGIALALLVFGASLVAAAPAGAAQAELASINFLPAVQSIGQNARVHLVNLGDATPGSVNLPPDPCRVGIQFIDAQGDNVGPGVVIAIGRGHTATVEAPVFVKTGLPVVLRAQVNVIRKALPPDPCAGLHGSYEVFDTATLETKFVSPGAIRGFNPQPDPPGVVGR